MRLKLSMPRLFLDTNIFVLALTVQDADCLNLLQQGGLEKVTNLDVTKELYRVLKKRFGYSEARLGEVMDFVRTTCRVAPRVPPKPFAGLRDANDRFILNAALRDSCDYLVTEDRKLRHDAQRYIKAVSAAQAIRLR